ncbi:MAG TPA: penicillin acylase family protein [Gammaproteobacteria bacterium]|nr:penicillin acylase family protein [Gammaproteobacteria bacterium]
MRRVATGVIGGIALLIVLVPITLYLLVRGSLPPLDGVLRVDGVGAPVGIDRDALGIPTLTARSRADLAFATGFVHAQDRYFQMDLMRRRAAGELAELFGPVALPADSEARLHRFRMRARQVLADADDDRRAVLEAYAAGVGAGLGSLGVRPFEYLLLRLAPRPWLAEDSVLVVYAMWLTLNDSTARGERERGLLAEVLPPALLDFIDPPGTRWDAAIDGSEMRVPPAPGPVVYDLRRLDPALFAAGPAPMRDPMPAAGSNNWAVAGQRTADGAALLANDMHLPLEVPNIWYRARLVQRTRGASAAGLDLAGLTLPGVPFLVAGSNGHVAWGFTNSYGDWIDVVRLELDKDGRYLTPAGPRRFGRPVETIRVRGQPDVAVELLTTIWGPVSGVDAAGRPLALRWLAHETAATNLELGGLERARDVRSAIELASGIGVPPQNFLVADRAGRIGWTIMGRIPVRAAYDARAPRSSADGGAEWLGWLPPADYPRRSSPAEDYLWTANARAVGGEALARIGAGGYPFGARAQQIRDGLRALKTPSVADMLRIQLDDRALYLGYWRDVLLDLLGGAGFADEPRRRALRELLAAWSGRAEPDSAAYRMVRDWHDRLLEAAFHALTAEVRGRFPGVQLRPPYQFAGTLSQLVEQRPLHLLDPRHASWDAFMLAQADAMLAAFEAGAAGPLAERTWGEVNTAQLRHPVSRALPALGRWLDMPPVQLPGDDDMPRVQRLSFGAAQRFAVSPGREKDGYLHLPAGQSGHPLSPWYRAGHVSWVNGEPVPFLPGDVAHRARLEPRR